MFMQRRFVGEMVNCISGGKPRELGDIMKSAVLVEEFMPRDMEGGRSGEQDFWYYTLFGDPALKVVFV